MHRLTGSHSAVLWDSAEEEDCRNNPNAPTSTQENCSETRPLPTHHRDDRTDNQHSPMASETNNAHQQSTHVLYADHHQPTHSWNATLHQPAYGLHAEHQATGKQQFTDHKPQCLPSEQAPGGQARAAVDSEDGNVNASATVDSTQQIRQIGLSLQRRHSAEAQQQEQQQQLTVRHAQQQQQQSSVRHEKQQQQQQQTAGHRQVQSSSARQQPLVQQPVLLPKQQSSDAYYVPSAAQRAGHSSPDGQSCSQAECHTGSSNVEQAAAVEEMSQRAQHGLSAESQAQQGHIHAASVSRKHVHPFGNRSDAKRAQHGGPGSSAFLATINLKASFTQPRLQTCSNPANEAHARAADVPVLTVTEAPARHVQPQAHSLLVADSAAAQTHLRSHNSNMDCQNRNMNCQTAAQMLGASDPSNRASDRAQWSRTAPVAAIADARPKSAQSPGSPQASKVPRQNSLNTRQSNSNSLNTHMGSSNAASEGSCGSTAQPSMMHVGHPAMPDIHSRHSVQAESNHSIPIVHANHALQAGQAMHAGQMQPDAHEPGTSHCSRAVHADSFSIHAAHQHSATTHSSPASDSCSFQAAQRSGDSDAQQHSMDLIERSAKAPQMHTRASAVQQMQALVSAPQPGLREEGSCSTMLSREGLEQDNCRLRHALSAIEQQLSMLRQGVEQQQVLSRLISPLLAKINHNSIQVSVNCCHLRQA